jgi:hypothetical protein
MIEIDITSDINEAMKDVADFFWTQIPFAMSGAMNKTALDVQRHLRGVTIPNAWENRNKALPRAMTTFLPHDENPRGGLTNAKDNRWSILIGPAAGRGGLVAGEGFAERQVTGETKLPKGGAVAVPIIGPGLRRMAGGSIPSSKKPKNNKGNDKYFRLKGSRVLYERQKKDIVPRFVLAPVAQGTKNLARFYPDAFNVVDRVFSGHMNTRMNLAISTSRFV